MTKSTDLEKRLAEENQRGYDEGRVVGHQEGLSEVSNILREKSAALFLKKHDDQAKFLRDLADEIGALWVLKGKKKGES